MSLEKAVSEGDLAAARVDLRNGADVNLRGHSGRTPLMVAAGLGHPQMVALLLKTGADPHMIETWMGTTALHKAAQSGNTDVIALLIDHGAFVDQQSAVLGNTPLIEAVLHMHQAAVQLLLARGARTTIRNHWQQSALELARDAGSETIVRELEARDANNSRKAKGLALITAIRAGDAAEAERLINAGVDINDRLPVIGGVDDDYTALGIAVRERQAAIVALLLKAGADPRSEIGLMRGTAIHEASFLGFTDVLRVLVDWLATHGSVSNELGAAGRYNGLTALHDAVWHGHLEAAQVLIKAGAPLTLRTHAGLTAREMAHHYGFDALAVMLAEAEKARSVENAAGSEPTMR